MLLASMCQAPVTERILLFEIDIVVKIQTDSGLVWSIPISTVIYVIIEVKICCRLSHLHLIIHNILTTVMTNIIDNKSTDGKTVLKPMLIC